MQSEPPQFRPNRLKPSAQGFRRLRCGEFRMFRDLGLGSRAQGLGLGSWSWGSGLKHSPHIEKIRVPGFGSSWVPDGRRGV